MFSDLSREHTWAHESPSVRSPFVVAPARLACSPLITADQIWTPAEHTYTELHREYWTAYTELHRGCTGPWVLLYWNYVPEQISSAVIRRDLSANASRPASRPAKLPCCEHKRWAPNWNNLTSTEALWTCLTYLSYPFGVRRRHASGLLLRMWSVASAKKRHKDEWVWQREDIKKSNFDGKWLSCCRQT